MVPRRMTKSEKDVFSGSSNFQPSGNEPLIAMISVSGIESIAIGDSTGLTIYYGPQNKPFFKKMVNESTVISNMKKIPCAISLTKLNSYGLKPLVIK